MQVQEKQTIKFEYPDSISLGYFGANVDYAFCSKQQKNRSTIQSTFVSCRETLAGHLVAYYNDNMQGDRANYKTHLGKIDLYKATCLAMRFGRYKRSENTIKLFKQTCSRLFTFSEHILNLLEKEVGFKPTQILPAVSTRVYQQDHYWGRNTLVDCYAYIEGDPRWVLSPQTISLYTLLLRMSFSVPALNSKIVPKLKSFNDLVRFLTNSQYASFKKDRSYLMSAPLWVPFLENLDKVFYKNPVDNYLYKHYDIYKKDEAHMVPHQGFESLTANNCKSTKIISAFNKYVRSKPKVFETSTA